MVKDQMDKLKDDERFKKLYKAYSSSRWIWMKKQCPRSATRGNEVCAVGVDILQVSPDDWCLVYG
ncbi:hypothetical protein BDA96_02G150300 [Sorghum bicolor]|jgi:hypothetical protein|uniref:Uncharacterized protein n=2 Tax=Sorghum bicolor TaxID=4558 RepID=A0A1W0W3U7_SORBI|nr:hypothetical protein BDA96_02G150300 [Sorghum bicolor]OQU89083.1 hypothetical protein SORBI_3002G144150 [Sorghum bicolor]OQU89084.1 hypothetical protein SORBI_3002G144150 [Sorghum bicolor]